MELLKGLLEFDLKNNSIIPTKHKKVIFHLKQMTQQRIEMVQPGKDNSLGFKHKTCSILI